VPPAPTPAANWAGNHTYRARTVHAPTTLDQVREIVAAAPHIRVLGSRHSFTDIADSPELVSLDGLPPDVVVDRDAMTVTCPGAMRYGELAVKLEDAGLGLANLASLARSRRQRTGREIATATSPAPSPRLSWSPPTATS
jgi:xylitol oxidase